MRDVKISFHLEREVQVEYTVIPEDTGGSHDSGDREKIPAHVEVSGVLIPVVRNGRETEEMYNIVNLLLPEEIQEIAEKVERGLYGYGF